MKNREYPDMQTMHLAGMVWGLGAVFCLIGYTSPIRLYSSTKGQARKGIIDGFVQVFRHRNIWLLFVIPGGFCGSVLAFILLFFTRETHCRQMQ